MLPRTVLRSLLGALALGLGLAGSGAPLQAQVIVGVVSDSATNAVIPGVMVSLQDSAQNAIAEVRTVADGRFVMDAQGIPKFRFAVRKLGAQPSYSGYYEVPAGVDTLQVDLTVPVKGIMIATVTVVAKPDENSNAVRLEYARENNFRIIEPWRVAQSRGISNSLEDLMRYTPLGGVRVPEQAGDCFSNKRGPRRVGRDCLVFVVDDLLLQDPYLHINPMDVHFIAYVPQTKARILWGPQAENGVLYIVTRRAGDNEERPKPKP